MSESIAGLRLCEDTPSQPPQVIPGCPTLDKQTYETHVDVDGTTWYILVARYSNRALVVVSSRGTFGSIVQAQKHTSLRGGLTYDTRMVLGNRNDEMPELCARMIVEAMEARGASMPIVLCLGVPVKSRADVSTLVEHVLKGFQSTAPTAS